MSSLAGVAVKLPCVMGPTLCGNVHSMRWYKNDERVFVFSSRAKISRAENSLASRPNTRWWHMSNTTYDIKTASFTLFFYFRCLATYAHRTGAIQTQSSKKETNDHFDGSDCHLGSNLIGYSYVPYMGSVCPGTEVLLRFLPMHNEGPIAPSYVCPSAFMRMFFNRFLSGLYTKSGELTKIFNLASSSRFRCKLDLIRMNCRHWMLEIPVVRFCQAFSSEISEERYIIENWATMELLQMLRELRNRVLNDSRSFQLLNRLPFWGKLPTFICRFASTSKPSVSDGERRLFPARSAVDFNYHYLRAVLAMAWIRSRQMGNVARPTIGSCVSHQRWPFPSLRRFRSCTFNKQAGDGQASNPYVTCRDLCEDVKL
ncbi:unnamed protein product [Nesidiocoris tenuis]|uniref:Uncharacterized protein n=1 Tax=Nesidiocoris tenuis TaxID=355587 RepID=A0A6H5GU14_9HEMI|nr:unnamed protein product [Nesidiocoris tenuis]